MIAKLKTAKAVSIIKSIIENKYFAFVTAFVTVLCYYLELELVTIYYLAVTGTAILLFSDDLTPLVGHMLFALILTSPAHSPSIFTTTEPSDFYLRISTIAQICICAAFLIAAAAYRMTLTFKSTKFSPTPVFISLAVFCAILILNGAASRGYTPRNIVYGLILLSCLVGAYFVLFYNIKRDDALGERLAFIFFALSLALLLEELVIYAFNFKINENTGAINRSIFSFGWGMYNNFACLMLFCLPFPFYLAGTKKHGFPFLIYGLILSIGLLFALSRQGMVALVLLLPSLITVLLLKGNNRLENSIVVGCAILIYIVISSIFGGQLFILLGLGAEYNKSVAYCLFAASLAIAAACAMLVLVKSGKVKLVISISALIIALFVVNVLESVLIPLLNSMMTSSSERDMLWRQALDAFSDYPSFGQGFYRQLALDPGFAGLNFIPDMYHNTFVQLLAACGFFAFAAYLFHRATTVYGALKNPTQLKTTIIASIAGMLVACLFDNHIFYPSGALIYGALLAFFDTPENAISNKTLN